MSKTDSFVADFLSMSLFVGESANTKTASPTMIPNLVEGTPEKSCSNCYFFQVYRPNLQLLHENANIIGPCNKWGAYTTAHRLCKAYEEGGPDVR